MATFRDSRNMMQMIAVILWWLVAVSVACGGNTVDTTYFKACANLPMPVCQLGKTCAWKCRYPYNRFVNCDYLCNLMHKCPASCLPAKWLLNCVADIPPSPPPSPTPTLPDASLLNATLPDASLLNATLPDASLLNATLPDASLSNATLSNATLPDASLLNATLLNATLPDASLSNATLPDASLSNASLSNATLSNASLLNATLPDATLPDASLSNASLSNATLPPIFKFNFSSTAHSETTVILIIIFSIFGGVCFMYCCHWLCKKIDKLVDEDWHRRLEETERRIAEQEHLRNQRALLHPRAPAPAPAPAPAVAMAPVAELAPEGFIECAVCTLSITFVFRSCSCTVNLCEDCRQKPEITKCPFCKNKSIFNELRWLYTDVSDKPLEPLRPQLTEPSTESSV